MQLGGFSPEQAKHLADDFDGGLTATGTSQATALELTKSVNVVSTVTNTNYCVVLPTRTSWARKQITVWNTDANNESLRIYAGAASYLDGAGLGGYVTLAPQCSKTFVAREDSAYWQTIAKTGSNRQTWEPAVEGVGSEALGTVDWAQYWLTADGICYCQFSAAMTAITGSLTEIGITLPILSEHNYAVRGTGEYDVSGTVYPSLVRAGNNATHWRLARCEQGATYPDSAGSIRAAFSYRIIVP